MIKLLLLIPTLDRSGAEKQLTLLATRLPKDDFDVHVAALTRGGPYVDVLKQYGIPCTVIGKRFKFDPFALSRLKKLIRETSPDVIHSWLFAANSYARLVAGKRERPRVVVSERCVDSWKSGWQLWLDRRQIARTHRLVANSNSVAEFYRQQGFPPQRITVIPNGVELPEFTSFPSSSLGTRLAVLREFDIPEDSRVVGYVGRLARQKRVRDLVWAMQLLRQLRERIHLLIVGDGPERKKLDAFAKHVGCDHLIRFAGHRNDASQMFAAIDVFWLASDFEGMSNSLMEAMAAGIPSVVTDIPPNRELVEDGKQGFVVKPGDSVGFAQFADRLLGDPQLHRRLGESARERMRTEFSIDKMVDSYARLYREIAV
jgi:glycosyltransferase involved in cell wall biosynthesis